MRRMSTGERSKTLGEDGDEVIGMITMTGNPDETVMVVSEKGYGKRSALEDYRITNRGGKGVKTIAVTEKTGNLVAIKNVDDSNDLMIINQSGITLRLPVSGIRVMGRATQGVKLIDLTKRGDRIASVCKVDSDPEEAAMEEAMDDVAADGRMKADNAEAMAETDAYDAQDNPAYTDDSEETGETTD